MHHAIDELAQSDEYRQWMDANHGFSGGNAVMVIDSLLESDSMNLSEQQAWFRKCSKRGRISDGGVMIDQPYFRDLFLLIADDPQCCPQQSGFNQNVDGGPPPDDT